VGFRRTTTRVRDDLAANVFVDDRVDPLVAPLKAIAARLGLVCYGRNNVTYADGIGSYLQLFGYLTGAAVPPDQIADVAEPRLLEQCADCDRCITTCPTGAIGDDRVLVRAHRCLTYANELPGEWPGWVPPHAHHCLMGCLACQRSCPANPPLQVIDTEVCFTPEETQGLLSGPDDAPGPVRQAILGKLEQLDLSSMAPLLGRNLQALIDKRAGDGGCTPS
jgi:epoxyqueuosine reductase